MAPSTSLVGVLVFYFWILPAVRSFSLLPGALHKVSTIGGQREAFHSLSTKAQAPLSLSACSSSALAAAAAAAGTTTTNDSVDADLALPSKAATSDTGTTLVVFVAGSAPSNYGTTSPLPNPSWHQVAKQLAKRLPNFLQVSPTNDDTDPQSSRIRTTAISLTDNDNNNNNNALDLPTDFTVIVALGVITEQEQQHLQSLIQASTNLQALLCDPTCAPEVLQLRCAGSYKANYPSWISTLVSTLTPWTRLASHQRLLRKADTLLARKSSEDYIFAVLFTLHALVTPLDVVKSDINPTWEKGPIRNIQEFATMVQCCGPQIQAALSDPKSKKAIDLLNQLDLRDQVGSYRVIVSNETPQLEDFTLCILQQNNCFQCDSPILKNPKVPLLSQWRGKPLDQTAARQILLGHLQYHPESALQGGGTELYSWKIVVGANPAYDAFPMQHQIFYPSTGNQQAMWYDPVFCVETLEGDLVWCKRHYRCTPRQHWSGTTAGAWTLTTLDNGMVSEEHWTTVDAADDLSWAVLHYSGAARRAGQSYVGALLCSQDGRWPAQAKPGSAEWDRIQTAFRNCDLELWELFGGSVNESYMWSSNYTNWAKSHPPPLERIGDMSITKWRKQIRERQANQQL